jgi:hypothetical protein
MFLGTHSGLCNFVAILLEYVISVPSTYYCWYGTYLTCEHTTLGLGIVYFSQKNQLCVILYCVQVLFLPGMRQV